MYLLVDFFDSNIYLEYLSIFMKKINKNKRIEYLISLFFNTGRLIKEQSCSNKNLKPTSIHYQHFSMLRIEVVQLIEAEKPTMKRIAEYLHIKAPSATSLVNGLVKAGYVKRTTDKKDRRIVQTTITDRGKIFLKDGLRQMTEKLKEVLLRLEQKQIDNFIKMMEEINNVYK